MATHPIFRRAQERAGEQNDSSGLPPVRPDRTDPFTAILAMGDSWFWCPKNSLVASILAFKRIDLNVKTHHSIMYFLQTRWPS